MSTSTPSSQLMRSTVEAMFEYLDRLEQAISDRADAAPERSNFGLPSYRFADEPPEPDSFSCGATVKFVFLGQEASKERMRTVDLTPNKIPAATKNDPEACRRKGLCFPNLVRQQFRVCGQDLVLTRNKAPYGRNHGVVRSADHEPQSLCFEPFRLNIAMSVARALGSETGTSDYEIWVAGEGFNTQWHFHLQFRKQRGPIWEHVDKQAPNSTGSWLLEDYPSQPQCFQDDNRSRLVETLYHEISPFLPINKCETELVSTPHRPAIGLLLSYEQARWKAILVKSWYQSGKLLFGKQPGLHEHLGEVILESLDEVQRVKDDPSAATQELEAQLKNWSTESAT